MMRGAVDCSRCGQACLHSHSGAVEVDVHGALQECGVEVFDVLVTHPAGVVDEDVELAKSFERRADQLPATLLRGQVATVADHAQAFALQCCGSSLGHRPIVAGTYLVGADIANDYPRPALGQRPRIAEPQSACTAGDDGCLAGEIHVLALLFGRPP